MGKVDIFVPGTPIGKDLEVKRNDTFIREFVAYNKDGSPYDFSDHEFHLQVKDEVDGEVIIDMDNDSFTIDRDEVGEDEDVDNKVIVEHDKEEMDVSGDYVWDLEFTTPDDRTFTWYEGAFYISKDITNSSND